MELLPLLKDVFFVHYQCEKFDVGTNIFELSYCVNDKIKNCSASNLEAEKILEYANKVRELQSRGLILVHWNQSGPNFGTDHINSRYKELTGTELNLEYNDNSINLGWWLIGTYGENYISHPRLDNLAKLNGFNGVSEIESGNTNYPSYRLSLITKIYFNALKGTLKTNIVNTRHSKSQQDKKKIPEKWHALLYLIRLNANGSQLPKNFEGVFIRTEIEDIGKKITHTKGQSFYRSIIAIDLNNAKELSNVFQPKWKEFIIEMSDNDPVVIDYLTKKYS